MDSCSVPTQDLSILCTSFFLFVDRIPSIFALFLSSLVSLSPSLSPSPIILIISFQCHKNDLDTLKPQRKVLFGLPDSPSRLMDLLYGAGFDSSAHGNSFGPQALKAGWATRRLCQHTCKPLK